MSSHNTLVEGHSDEMIRRILKGRVPHICVVGAGMSGLRCAGILTQNGMKVTILEARDRIGGRVHQSSHLGHLVDLGPNWIHGTDHNPILDIAKETNTTTYSPEEGGSVYDELGHLMSQEKAQVHSEIVWGIIADAFKLSNAESTSLPSSKSLLDFFKEKVKEKNLEDESQKVVLQMCRIWGAFVGDIIDKQSLKYFWLEECIEGENLFVASTYTSILSLVAKSALAKSTLHLSTPVTSITSTASTTGNPSIALTTATSPTPLVFDEVIMTAPLGWLKRHQDAFSPPLPRKITSAINNISYGRLEKVYITFPSAFWLPSTTNNTEHPPAPRPSFFTQFLPPKYSPNTNPEAWPLEFVSLASLPVHTAHPTLLFYLHGPCAAYITSLTTSLPPTSQTYYERLNTFFAPYYSLLPFFSASNPACTPTAFLATDWTHDEWAGWGSYTNFQVSGEAGTEDGKHSEHIEYNEHNEHGQNGEVKGKGKEAELDKDIEALRQGCGERGVWFAGEHTAPFVALGTVTGAWWSGEGVGRRVVGAYGNGGGGVNGEEVGSKWEGGGE